MLLAAGVAFFLHDRLLIKKAEIETQNKEILRRGEDFRFHVPRLLMFIYDRCRNEFKKPGVSPTELAMRLCEILQDENVENPSVENEEATILARKLIALAENNFLYDSFYTVGNIVLEMIGKRISDAIDEMEMTWWLALKHLLLARDGSTLFIFCGTNERDFLEELEIYRRRFTNSNRSSIQRVATPSSTP